MCCLSLCIGCMRSVFDPSQSYDIQPAPARGLLLCGATFDRYERMCQAAMKKEEQQQSNPFSIAQAVRSHQAEIIGPSPPCHTLIIRVCFLSTHVLFFLCVLCSCLSTSVCHCVLSAFKCDVLEREICSLSAGHAAYRQWLIALDDKAIAHINQQQ